MGQHICERMTEHSSVWHHVSDVLTALAHLRHHFLVALRLANLRYINLINNNNNNNTLSEITDLITTRAARWYCFQYVYVCGFVCLSVNMVPSL